MCHLLDQGKGKELALPGIQAENELKSLPGVAFF